MLCNVKCNYIDAEGCVLINVTANSIIARPGCIIYNVMDESNDGIELTDGQVLAGVFSEGGDQLVMKSSTSIDGGKNWEQQLEWNSKSFEEVYNMNADANPINIESEINNKHSSLWNILNFSKTSAYFANNDIIEEKVIYLNKSNRIYFIT